MVRKEQYTSKSAKLLYRPFGLLGSIVGGLVPGSASSRCGSVPLPDTRRPAGWPRVEYPVRQIVVATTFQGAIYALVKALIDRGGARLFQRSTTGEWSGD